MPTRHANTDAPISDERYLSSSDYVAVRGVSGKAVAAKAALIQDPKKRALLWFIHAMLMKPGGAKKLGRDLVEMFPDRLCSPTMYKNGLMAGQTCSARLAASVRYELEPNPDNYCRRYWESEDETEVEDLCDLSRGPGRKKAEDVPVEELLAECRQRAENGLGEFLVELCINPWLQLCLPNEPLDKAYDYLAQDENPAVLSCRSEAAAVPYFRDLVGALTEYKARHEAAARKDFVETALSRKIFENLEFCLKTKQIVVVEGKEGLGKSESVRNWCEMHLGEARLVELSSITGRTTFFQAIAKALGIGASVARKANEMQIRVEGVLQQSGIMLVIDEAHYALPQSRRVYTRPELVDWVYTALYNHRVPCAMIATPQFSILIDHVEKATGWNSNQFKRRAKRWIQLPDRHTPEDIEAVARKLLPEAKKTVIQILVGYAGSLEHQMDGLVDTVREARLIAEADGRGQITFQDVEKAIGEVSAPTLMAKVMASKERTKTKLRQRKPAPLATAVQVGGNPPSGALQSRIDTPRPTDFAGDDPALRLSIPNDPGDRTGVLLSA